MKLVSMRVPLMDRLGNALGLEIESALWASIVIELSNPLNFGRPDAPAIRKKIRTLRKYRALISKALFHEVRGYYHPFPPIAHCRSGTWRRYRQKQMRVVLRYN